LDLIETHPFGREFEEVDDFAEDGPDLFFCLLHLFRSRLLLFSQFLQTNLAFGIARRRGKALQTATALKLGSKSAIKHFYTAL
jgi:hypothetical protein